MIQVKHCSLDQELFLLIGQVEIIVGFLSVLNLVTLWSSSQCLLESGYSDCWFDSTHYGNHIHLAFVSGVPSRGPFYITIQLFPLHVSFPSKMVPVHTKVWSVEGSSHGSLQKYWGSRHRFISHSTSKRYIFWTILAWVSRYLFSMGGFKKILGPEKCMYDFFFFFFFYAICLQGSGAPVAITWKILLPLFGLSKNSSVHSMTGEAYGASLACLFYFF